MKIVKYIALAMLASITLHPAFAGGATPVGSYVGILPCADCPALEIRLDVFDDGAFHQRTVYRDRPGRFDRVGRWVRDGDTLELRYTDADPVRFRIGDGYLNLLDQSGKPIVSRLGYALHRSERLGRIEPEVLLEGHFTYYADSAMLHDCATGRHMPVAMEGDYLRLERAWGHAGASLEQPLPTVVRGRIVERVNMEGPLRPTVIVERLVSAGKPVSCTPRPAPGLTGTRWNLLRLGDLELEAGEDELSAHLAFTDGTPARASGSTGCNRFSGNVVLTGGSVLFGALASTKMACLDSQPPEQDFFAALEQARSWRISGRRLELLDARGGVAAVFQAP